MYRMVGEYRYIVAVRRHNEFPDVICDWNFDGLLHLAQSASLASITYSVPLCMVIGILALPLLSFGGFPELCILLSSLEVNKIRPSDLLAHRNKNLCSTTRNGSASPRLALQVPS